jgi:hypothetical protein
MAMAVAFGRLDHGLDLGRRQVLSSPEFGVWAPGRSNCSIYFSWRDQLEIRFCQENLPSPEMHCQQSASWKATGESNCRGRLRGAPLGGLENTIMTTEQKISFLNIAGVAFQAIFRSAVKYRMASPASSNSWRISASSRGLQRLAFFDPLALDVHPELEDLGHA